MTTKTATKAKTNSMVCAKGKPITAERFNDVVASLQKTLRAVHLMASHKGIQRALATANCLDTKTGDLTPLVDVVQEAYEACGYSFDKELFYASNVGSERESKKAVAELKAKRAAEEKGTANA